ncbi:hypothetical protein [Gilvimarinus algae]|uniref:Uncharacterized protein n=1 Tax=Gilvimarinus algae TaxID=3058037 RepID=A0ABT8TMI7_9GAMM|nr:hypothetical protein [Gilvimarinus sp. SDUM040014]MDO3383861.1 hypothetical protein [Gilvimarinus sp. SDUM040014]
MKNVKLTAGLGALLLGFSASALTYEYPEVQYYSQTAPTPYDEMFQERAGCEWEFVTSYGGWGGYMFVYEPVGACQYSEQHVSWSGYQGTSAFRYGYITITYED